MALSDWDNSAWTVVKPLEGYRKVGYVLQSNTYVGSSMMLPNVYQEVKLKKGDIVLGLVGGDFWMPKGSSIAYEILLKVSDKHPFEKSYGGSSPFIHRWPVDRMKKLDALPEFRVERGNKKFDRVPEGAKRVGHNIDVILPAGAKVESLEFLNDFKRMAVGRDMPSLSAVSTTSKKPRNG